MCKKLKELIEKSPKKAVCVPDFRSFSNLLMDTLKKIVATPQYLSKGSISSSNSYIVFCLLDNNMIDYYYTYTDTKGTLISIKELEMLVGITEHPKTFKRIEDG